MESSVHIFSVGKLEVKVLFERSERVWEDDIVCKDVK